MKRMIDLAVENPVLAGLSAEERIRWAADNFGAGAVLLSSMQKTASVLMHLFYRLGIENEVLFVDTGFHFHETLAFRDLMMRKYKLNLMTVYPEQTPEQQESAMGRKLHMFVDGQPECCRLRKEKPFGDYMLANQKRLVIGGTRRSEGGRRANVRCIEMDPRIDGYSFHPIFDWTSEQVMEYLRTNEVPIHPLHAKSYPSIGCACCTTPVGPGEDARAGRWRHLRKEGENGPMYCGINFVDGGGI